MAERIAVVLFNLGAPDAPEAVQPFLFNLFNDRAIIALPQPLRSWSRDRALRSDLSSGVTELLEAKKAAAARCGILARGIAPDSGSGCGKLGR